MSGAEYLTPSLKAIKAATFSTAYSGPLVHEAMQAGREQDADAVFLATISGRDLACALVVGRSLLFGEEAMGHLVDYYGGDTKRVDEWIERVASDAADDLKRDGEVFYGVLRDAADQRWRGFRGAKPMNVDAVRAAARAQTN